jgi:hypothetical protein
MTRTQHNTEYDFDKTLAYFVKDANNTVAQLDGAVALGIPVDRATSTVELTVNIDSWARFMNDVAARVQSAKGEKT